MHYEFINYLYCIFIYFTALSHTDSDDNSADEESPCDPPTPDVNSPHNIDVPADRTWMTRGYSSKVGVTSVIGQVTGKVLDTEVKSKVFKSCDYWEKRKEQRPDDYQRWLLSHPAQCEATHTGSSGAMEAAADVAIFHRPINSINCQQKSSLGINCAKNSGVNIFSPRKTNPSNFRTKTAFQLLSWSGLNQYLKI